MTVKIQGPLYAYVRSERHGKVRYHCVGQAIVLIEGEIIVRLDVPVAVTELHVVPHDWVFDDV
jgi:lipoate-protein ligase B